MDGVYGMAMALTRKRAEAEDLVQETYLRAYRAFDQFAPGTNCRAWLLTILRHHFLNRLKKSSREVLEWDVGEPEWGDERNSSAWLETPEAEFFRRVGDVEVRQALEALPLPFREVVILADLEDFSYKEIAEILGCPVGTVMSRLYRGRNLLRKALLNFARDCGYLPLKP
ncbi:MAG: sigma-70 family RNA polymerase sigma factor [Candidatus Rokubacteria bacterium]|nr:sigma-70 family RNA polymerase sigma factor [Candidatus Rokubacteria bacterium]